MQVTPLPCTLHIYPQLPTSLIYDNFTRMLANFAITELINYLDFNKLSLPLLSPIDSLIDM